MTTDKIVKFASGAFMAIGIALIFYYSNWQTALGVFLFVWMNNMDYKKK